MSNENVFTNLWQSIRGLANQNAQKYLYVPIPQESTDRPGDSTAPLKAEASYFRLWLAEMFLTQSKAWFVDWFPAVHSTVRLKFGGRPEVEFSRVAQTSRQALNQGIQLNHQLTDLLPFNGGVVDIDVGLCGLKGDNKLEAAIGVLTSFSSLVAAPLGQAITIAGKVSTGMQSLLNAADGVVHLPFFQAFTAAGGDGGNELRPGYIAVVLASAAQIDRARERFSVADNRLLLDGQPLCGFDYMLLRVEGRSERDDYHLPNIQEPLDQAKQAIIQGETEKADAFKKMALLAAWQATDLVNADRRRVVQAIKDELKEITDAGLGAVPEGERDLHSIIEKRAMPMGRAAAPGPLRFEELFSE